MVRKIKTEAERLPYVACVSWPRSGHHLLQRLLSDVFGRHFGYCSYYTKENEISDCCGQFPCSNAGLVSMSKQHDFKLDKDLPYDHKLIVQIRRFDEAVTSDYELFISSSGNVDDFETFQKFARSSAKRYNLFLRKWVRSERTNRVVVRYGKLTTKPYDVMLEILDLYQARNFEPCIQPAIDKIKHITFASAKQVVHEQAGVKNRRDHREFRHFKPKLFRELRRIAQSNEPT